MNLMKNLGDQFGDEEEEEKTAQKAKSAASRRPADVVLEHANETYTQRFCAYQSHAQFPLFCRRYSVAVSPFPLAVAVSVHRCRYRCRCASFCRLRL